MIVDSPYLRSDTTWREFMKSDSNLPSPAPGGKVDKLEKTTVNIGESMLVKTLSQLETPSKEAMQKKMVDIKDEVTSIASVVRSFLEQARVCATIEKSLLASNKQLASCIADWIREEKNCARYLGSNEFNENQSRLKPHELVTSTLEATGLLISTKCASQELFPEHTSFSLVCALEQELANIESLKELCATHGVLQRMIDSLNVKLAGAVSSKSSTRQQVMAELTQQISEKELCLSAFYKGFVYFTMPLYSRLRAATLRKLTGAMASATLTSSYSLQYACKEFFASLNIEPSAAIVNTSSMLDLLSMRPLEVPPDEVTTPMRPLIKVRILHYT